MKNKTIWIINQTAGKIDSGWGERHYFMSQYWQQKGYRILIFSGSYNHLFINQPENCTQRFNKEKINDNLSFCWVKIPKYDGGSVFKLWSMMVFAWKMCFYKSSDKPDVILVSSMPIFSILSGIWLKKKYKAKRLLFEIRDLWPLTPMYLSGFSKWHPMIVFMKWVEKVGYLKSDAIVSVLPNANKYIDPISKDKTKFNYIPNGIDKSLIKNESLTEKFTTQLPKDKFVIGYAGTMGMANALEYLVEASIQLKENNSIHFVLVGDGYLKSELQEKTKGNKNITFCSKINKNQVQSLLEFFDVCFIGRNNTPLFDFGVSSNKYFDYMLASKPVLESSNMINSPAQLANCGLTVSPENGEAIVEGIIKLYELPGNELKNLGKKGFQYVSKYHNFDYLSSKYENLF